MEHYDLAEVQDIHTDIVVTKRGVVDKRQSLFS